MRKTSTRDTEQVRSREAQGRAQEKAKVQNLRRGHRRRRLRSRGVILERIPVLYEYVECVNGVAAQLGFDSADNTCVPMVQKGPVCRAHADG